MNKPGLADGAISSLKNLIHMTAIRRGFGAKLDQSNSLESELPVEEENPLRKFFEARKDGPGIWKWLHYFDIYHEHFKAFRGREVHVAEIGVYSGGSLDMWQDYFGPKAHIYGVDIEPSCRAYEQKGYKIFIGDQADRSFWKDFKRQVPKLDIVIDDGGHHPEQQIPTLEELLPHLRPGGVFLCEDVHKEFNAFTYYINGLSHRLNAADQMHHEQDSPDKRIVANPTTLQRSIQSIHLYPYVAVIKKNRQPLAELRAPKHGSEWQPFLK
jgi:hypothetical protein